MSETRHSLCPNCDACPEVVIAEGSVVIGEEGNHVRLSAEEWNVLVSGVKSGALTAVGAGSEGAPVCACGCDCCS